MLFHLVYITYVLYVQAISAAELNLKAVVQDAEQAARIEKKAAESLGVQAKREITQEDNRCPIGSCMGLNVSEKGSEKTSPLLDTNKPLIFVSSSMPIASLKRLSYQAQQQGAILVIRGMVDGSMHKTAQLVDQMDHPLEIDPKLFEQFGIDKVPMFIIPHKRRWYKVAGNVELTFALERVYTQTENIS